MRRNQRLVLLLFLTFRALRNPLREFWITKTFKLLKYLFRLEGIFLLNLRILSRKNNIPTLFILFRPVTVITSISDRPIISLVHVWKSIIRRSSFVKKKENSALSEHACLTNHTVGWDKSKIITTNLRYHLSSRCSPNPSRKKKWGTRVREFTYSFYVKI